MGAVALLARSEIRQRWRSTVAITLLVGVVGALVLATVAGARRSDTALDRFNAYSRSANVELAVGKPTAEQLSAFRRTPGIAAQASLRVYVLEIPDEPNLAIAAPLDDAIGTVMDRSRLVSGRRADPSAPDEITVGEALAEKFHLRVGDQLDARSFSPRQIVGALAGEVVRIPRGPRIKFRVVGIERRPLDLGVRAGSGGVVVLTRAFERMYHDKIGFFTDLLRVRTTSGRSGVEQITAAARRQFRGTDIFDVNSLGVETEGARNAIDVLTQALWIMAAVTALGGFVAIGIVLTRDIAHAGLAQATLQALGLTRGQRVAASAPRAVIITCTGALLAGIGAICLSPLFPFGVARRADPDPGLHADWAVLGLAIPLVAAIVLTIALFAAMRATRRSAFEDIPHAYRRTSTIVDLAAGAGLRPTATNGLRLALQSGRGETAVPVRSAFAGAVFGVAGVTAALVFAASLNHLVATPQLYGWTFDIKGSVPVDRPCGDTEGWGLAREPGVRAVATVCYSNLELDGQPVIAWGFQSLRGTINPEIVAGHAPHGPKEVALGSVTLDSLGKHLGDTVTARGDKTTRRYVVVGRVVLPTIDEAQPLADGAAFTSAGLLPLLDNGANETHFLVARLGRGTDATALVRRLELVKGRDKNGNVHPLYDRLGTPTIPVEVARMQQIDRIPALLAALLGGLALLAVGHALVSAVRRRRRELALLKVLGFDRGQVRATVAWQATTLGTIGLVFGIPIGIVVGRLVWRLVADGLGVSNGVTTPEPWLIVLVPSALVLVNLIAFFPARSAARTRPAVALRSA